MRRAWQARKKRHVYPESSLWESEGGRAWLSRLVVAVLLEFGLKDGIGAERISNFFHRIQLDKEIAVSETALLQMMKRLEELVIEYAQAQEDKQTGKVKEVTVGADETFFAGLMLLVAMELGSGYLLLEEAAPDRSFETWSERLDNRLKPLGCHVRHFVSDRAKALIKLGVAGLNCHSGADLFHAMQDLTRWLGIGFWHELGKAQKTVLQTRDRLKLLSGDADVLSMTNQPPAIEAAVKNLTLAEMKQKCLEQGKEQYRKLLHGISKTLHPFDLSSKRQDAPQVKQALCAKAQALDDLGKTHDISDKSGKLGKFTRQIDDLVSGVEAWWLWVAVALETLNLSSEQQSWVRDYLLPKVYWEQQIARTDTPELRDVYQSAHQIAEANLQNHLLTSQLSAHEKHHCYLWAEWMSRQFQRSSSAIEGRNGYLSCIHHNSRGFSARRLKAMGVIHNFDTCRADGTTPAERLFGGSFPDLFECLLRDFGPIPIPRTARKTARHDRSLILRGVAG